MQLDPTIDHGSNGPSFTVNHPKQGMVVGATIPFRVETKKVYICCHGDCNKKYSRMPDLCRHHRGVHQNDRRFKCRVFACEPAIRGFPRRDKRDAHEKKMHVEIGDGIFL
jgi:hypothetical protein